MQKRYKYPRTFHLPISPGVTEDDKVLNDLSSFIGKEVIVTEKMDGENTSIYNDYFHARSIDSNSHISQSYVKGMIASVRFLLKRGERICGENMFAKHSIEYNDLPSYFLGFSFWQEDICLDWDNTIDKFNHLGIIPVPQFYRGIFDLDQILKQFEEYKIKQNHEVEGFVIRLSDSFTRHDFNKSVIKYVRENHVQTDQHWKNQKIIPNKLK